jgi:flavin-dependent dehydrogenase
VSPARAGFDVVVLGGGPGGSVCAARLASRGRSVVVLERDHHPRFHLGESLLPNSLAVLDAIGALEPVRARFLVKRGARFVDAADARRSARYAFAEAFGAKWDHAFQVPRDEFDELLFRHAGACGAELREGWEAERVLTRPATDGARAAGVQARSPEGQVHTIPARFVVDATGREALVARAAGDVRRIAHLDRTAIYTQVRGAWRDTADREGDIQIVVFGAGEERGWFWFIPFADGRTSMGAVVSSAWVQSRRSASAASAASAPGAFAALGGHGHCHCHCHCHCHSTETLLDAALAEAPAASAMVAGAERLFVPRATADFSFRVRTIHGPGWLALGDAAGFIDPLFSTGAHLAMHGALRAADAIDAALGEGDLSPARFDGWAHEQRAGVNLFLGAVQAFYAGDLVSYLFCEAQHPFLRRAITTLLAGDVFDGDARWSREMRSRFPAVP